MIKSSDDIRYSQDVFGCFPVADMLNGEQQNFWRNIRKLMIIILCVKHV